MRGRKLRPHGRLPGQHCHKCSTLGEPNVSAYSRPVIANLLTADSKEALCRASLALRPLWQSCLTSVDIMAILVNRSIRLTGETD